tara:strand:- start:466 stop:1275 length:810 start_codon:yes stop_codon:yes gene_type:complete
MNTQNNSMLEDFLSKNYNDKQLPVQRCRWKKRIKYADYCIEKNEVLKGSELTMMNLFNYALELYKENEQLKQNNIIVEPVIVKHPTREEIVVQATLFNNHIDNGRIDTCNIITGKLFKKEDIIDIEETKTIVEETIDTKPISVMKTEIEEEEETGAYYEGGVKIITCRKNPDIKPILRMMRGKVNTFHIQVIMMKKYNTQKQVFNWFNGKHDAGNPKDILDIYKETTKYCRLSDELYKKFVEGAVKHVNQAFNIYMNNFENKELDLRKS